MPAAEGGSYLLGGGGGCGGGCGDDAFVRSQLAATQWTASYEAAYGVLLLEDTYMVVVVMLLVKRRKKKKVGALYEEFSRAKASPIWA